MVPANSKWAWSLSALHTHTSGDAVYPCIQDKGVSMKTSIQEHLDKEEKACDGYKHQKQILRSQKNTPM